MFEKKPRIVNLETIENLCQSKKLEKKKSIIMSPKKSIIVKKNNKIIPKKIEVKKVDNNLNNSGDDILWL